MKRRGWLACGGLLVAGGIFLVLVGLLLTGFIYYYEYQTSARRIDHPKISTTIPETYNLSPSQTKLVKDSGYPDSFLLMFYEEQQDDGLTGGTRYEVWEYYRLDTQYIFINGESEGEQPLEAGDVEPLPTAYKPEQFQAYMSLDEVVTAAQLQSYLAAPLEKSLLTGGEIYYAGGLAFGLKDGQLLYIETFIGEEGE